MDNSTVFFIDVRATYQESFVSKIGKLLDAAGLASLLRPRDLAAVKIHFGEKGNTAFIRPAFLRKIVASIKEAGARPFLTDANTLYAGTRGDAVLHLQTAIQNGFAYAVVEAPLVIADGLRGRSETAVPIAGRRFSSVYIGKEIVEADALISVAHFKGHELSGFGGTLKNVGMGCASRRGKLAQHSTVCPKVKTKRCVGCEECAGHCAAGAIAVAEGKARIDPERCIGCGECILICPNGAVQIQWNQAVPVFMENMVEYTAGVLQGKQDRALFINFLTDISPGCDCLPMNDAPIVRNIGVVASTDPVAIDQASLDLVNQEAALPGCCLSTNRAPGEDKFKGVYPKIDAIHQLAYAEEMGLGCRRYHLETV